MNILKMLILMLVMSLTFTGCKKDVDDILTRKDGKWSVTSNKSNQKSIWVFEKDGKLYFEGYDDNTAMEWYWNKNSNEIILSVFGIDGSSVSLKYKIIKSTNNEQEWLYGQGKQNETIYYLKRLK